MRAWRESRGLSQSEAAELVGVSQPAWYNYEHSKRVPPLDVALRICKLTAAAHGCRITPEMFAKLAAELAVGRTGTDG